MYAYHPRMTYLQYDKQLKDLIKALMPMNMMGRGFVQCLTPKGISIICCVFYVSWRCDSDVAQCK